MNKVIVGISASLALLTTPMAAAKNVIFFLGDGMGISTVTAARIFAGQQQGLAGEEYDLAFDKFDNVALIKTYNTDAQVADSAGTITAIMTGQKTRIGVIGINANAERDNCHAALKARLTSLAELAEDKGLRTGIVSTARITHATPAGAYAHTANRNWEDSSSLPEAARDAGCQDIALQLIETNHGDGPDVIFGGGRAQFFPISQADPEYKEWGGKRNDGRNLVEEWLARSTHRKYVWNRKDFLDLGNEGSSLEAPPRQWLGLFEPSHMKFEADRSKDRAGEPSLLEMTKVALAEMQKSEDGYFLLIEAGRIDHAHHAGNAYRALVDTVMLSDSVQWVVDNANLRETLVLVTADHSHTMTINGYPRRGNPILGLVELPAEGNLGGDDSATEKAAKREFAKDATGLPYTTLSYANGGGYKKRRLDLSKIDTEDVDYQQLATVPMYSETHAGEDVAAYAIGLNAVKVRGVMEQNELYYVMHGALFD